MAPHFTERVPDCVPPGAHLPLDVCAAVDTCCRVYGDGLRVDPDAGQRRVGDLEVDLRVAVHAEQERVLHVVQLRRGACLLLAVFLQGIVPCGGSVLPRNVDRHSRLPSPRCWNTIASGPTLSSVTTAAYISAPLLTVLARSPFQLRGIVLVVVCACIAWVYRSLLPQGGGHAGGPGIHKSAGGGKCAADDHSAASAHDHGAADAELRHAGGVARGRAVEVCGAAHVVDGPRRRVAATDDAGAGRAGRGWARGRQADVPELRGRPAAASWIGLEDQVS
mmetsp:Transcript_1173/g.3399  ORF Transcript_1173/g.3399 Transcript_1173/m.3399 type:complete len:278 (+) Transcript_1173:136-969(+)